MWGTEREQLSVNPQDPDFDLQPDCKPRSLPSPLRTGSRSFCLFLGCREEEGHGAPNLAPICPPNCRGRRGPGVSSPALPGEGRKVLEGHSSRSASFRAASSSAASLDVVCIGIGRSAGAVAPDWTAKAAEPMCGLCLQFFQPERKAGAVETPPSPLLSQKSDRGGGLDCRCTGVLKRQNLSCSLKTGATALWPILMWSWVQNRGQLDWRDLDPPTNTSKCPQDWATSFPHPQVP